MVADLTSGGPAEKDGRIQRGDILLSVNDEPLSGITKQIALERLKSAASPVKLMVLRENPHAIFASKEGALYFFIFIMKKWHVLLFICSTQSICLCDSTTPES